MSIFTEITPFPPDPIFGLQRAFERDPHPHKIDLTVGVYRGEDFTTTLLSAIKEGEKRLYQGERAKGYLPIEGEARFIEASQQLLFGPALYKSYQKHLLGVQSLGGTGALYLGGALLAREVYPKIALPTPTWPNHRAIFEGCGMEVVDYPYYEMKGGRLQFDEMVARLSQFKRKTTVLLHGCCHNPSGLDPTKEQWRALSSLFLKRGLIPFFDFAYQGFGEGVEEDSWAIRHFLEEGHELFVASSYSKNFTLYGERVGCLSLSLKESSGVQKVRSALQRFARRCYSNPPRHGALLVATILEDLALTALWRRELEAMRLRLSNLRSSFVEQLEATLGSARFNFLKSGKGLFALLGLEERETEQLKEKEGIYLAKGGRLNLSGLSPSRLPRLLSALAQTIQ